MDSKPEMCWINQADIFNPQNLLENRFRAEPASNSAMPPEVRRFAAFYSFLWKSTDPVFFLPGILNPKNALENLFRAEPASNQRLRRLFFFIRSAATNFE